MAYPNFQLYGSGPDQLAAQQQFYGQLWNSAAEGNRASAVRAAEVSLQSYLDAQRADEAARAGDQSRDLRLWQYGIERGDRRASAAEDRRRFDVDTGLRRADTQARVKIAGAKDLEKAADDAARFQDKLAKEEADAGMLFSEADTAKKFTALPKESVKSYTARSLDVRSQLEESQSRMEDAAKAINRAKQLTNYKTLSEQAMKDMPKAGWSWEEGLLPQYEQNPEAVTAKRNIQDWNAELYGPSYDPLNPAATSEPNNLSARAAALEQNKQIMDPNTGLLLDPNTGRVAARARPPWLPPQTTTDTIPPASVQFPPAPINVTQRRPGQIYLTPRRGPMLWTGTGWQSP